MSVGISIQFLAGRYHATPWNHQVNEGVVEFPPSPWRVLRSLVAGYYRLPVPPDRAEVCQLLTQLADQLPSYRLPRSHTAHTRHYMPTRKEGKETTTRVFDTFLVLGDGALSPEAEVEVIWEELQLTSEQVQLLQQLCGQVGYLGRAESWAELSVRLDSSGGLPNATPVLDTVETDRASSSEWVKLLAPLDESGLAGFRSAIEILPKPKKAKWRAPADVLEALELDVGSLHAQGWSGVPGTRWVTYEVKSPPTAKSLPDPIHPKIYPTLDPPTLARFALVSAVLPSLTQAVSIGDRFHKALIRWSDDGSGADDVFTGRDADGNPLQERHAHAQYFSEDADGDGKIDHVLVYAPKGFRSERAIVALSNLSRVWGDEGVDLQTVLVGLGKPEDYRTTEQEEAGRSRIVGTGRVWRSATPVVLTRFPKCNRRGEPKLNEDGLQIDSPEHQVRRYLQQMGRDQPERIEPIFEGGREGDRRRFRWQEFQRQRTQGQGKKSFEHGYGFELTFEKPQQGPIALGYAAHFGLGLFVPVR